MSEEKYMSVDDIGKDSQEKPVTDKAGPEKRWKDIPEITLHFGKGLCGEPFSARDGKTYVEIKVPNADPDDKRPWESFILPEKSVHENKFGKGLWAKIPENGHTTLRRPVNVGKNEQGRNVWKYEKRNVTNSDLKNIVEFYKTKDHGRESVTESLKKGKEEASKVNEKSDGIREDMPFR